MVSESQKRKNKYMADAIKKWMLENEVADDSRIYFNGKCYSSIGYGENAKYETLHDIKGSDYTKYANDDTITMTYEGIFHSVINSEYGRVMLDSFDRLIESFGYYYELGHSWSLSLYKDSSKKKEKKKKLKYADFWKVGGKY